MPGECTDPFLPRCGGRHRKASSLPSGRAWAIYSLLFAPLRRCRGRSPHGSPELPHCLGALGVWGRWGQGMLIMQVPFIEFLLEGTSCAGVSVTHSSSSNHITALQRGHHPCPTGVVRAEDIISSRFPPCKSLQAPQAHSLPCAPSCPPGEGLFEPGLRG